MKLIIAVAALTGMLVAGCAPRESFQAGGADTGSDRGRGHGSSLGTAQASPKPGQVPETRTEAKPDEPGLGPKDAGRLFEDSPGSPDFILPRNRNASLDI